MDTNILLESGTNEMEILEFIVGGNRYGINVAKIREIITYRELTPIPNGHPNIEGAFNTRGETISVVNLARVLGMPEQPDSQGQDMILIAGFNMVTIGFHVHGVIGIHRLNWGKIITPDSMISNSSQSSITGIIDMEDRLIMVLDFEAIVADISPDIGINPSDVQDLGERKRNTSPIYFAEDSHMLSRLIYDGLKEAGYVNVAQYDNGLELWNVLQRYKKAGTLKKNIGCVVTDIEMPQMDGHRLIKLMKQDEELREIPVVIFSSLINEEMERKGKQLGADAQFSKNQMRNFIKKLDELTGGDSNS